MKVRNCSSIWLAAFLLATLSLTGCAAPTDQGDAKKSGGLLSGITGGPKPVTIPVGTVLDVVLDQSVSSKGSRSGDAFDATLIEPIVIDGKTVVVKDARVKGRVLDAQESGRLQTPARLSLGLSAIEAAGSWHDIATSSVSMAGKSHKTRDIEMIGGGTAVGAIIGGIAGHGKGAAIGAAAGAGAGTGAAALTGKKDIVLPAESRLSFRLTQPLTIQVKN